MLNRFGKKEEPEKEYTLMEICTNHICVREVSYIPNKIFFISVPLFETKLH